MFLLQRNYGFNGIIYREFLLLIATPFFRIWTSQQQSPPKVYPVSAASHTFPPPPETGPRETWTQSFVINFLNPFNPFNRFNPCQYGSNHHKQHLLIITSKISHYLLQLQIIKVKKFHLRSACYYKFHALTIEHSHFALPKPILYFLTACGRSKENLSIPGVT